MPTNTDCLLTGDMYATDRMREVFGSTNKLQKWLDTEAALAEAQAHAGIVPQDAANRIREVARAENFNLEDLRSQVDRGRRHILFPMLEALSGAAGEDAGRFVHWGATTQDILDTGLVLQIREALDVIDGDLSGLITSLEGLAETHRDTVMAGRTHWQHALPLTFGLKVAIFLEEFRRHARRLEIQRREVLRAQLGGGGGTLASLGSAAAEVQSRFSRILELQEPKTPWFASRDATVELVSTLGLMAGSIERLVLTVGRLAATEIGEVFEPRRPGQVGSSTMPQKRNPILSERTAATCKLIRGQVPVAQSCMVVEHDRDMSTYMAEYFLVPQVMMMMGCVLENARYIMDGITVDPERMRENLALTRGGIVAEAVMMGLASHVGRVRAHELAMEAAQEAHERGDDLLEVLLGMPAVTQVMGADELAELVDPSAYTGLSSSIVDDVIQR